MSSPRCNKQLIYQLFFPISENLDEEKKEREHLLALNQVIAQQVLQKRRSLPGKISTIDFKTMHEAAHPSGRITNHKLRIYFLIF